jgi:hypothetical protein
LHSSAEPKCHIKIRIVLLLLPLLLPALALITILRAAPSLPDIEDGQSAAAIGHKRRSGALRLAKKV